MQSESLKVLHLSTWNVPCGIAGYCANLVKGLTAEGVYNEVFPLKPHDWVTFLPKDVDNLMNEIVNKAKQFDVVHIQHEHAFFGHLRNSNYSIKQYGEVLRRLRAINKPVVTTFHTEVNFNANTGRKRFSPKYYIEKIRHWIRTRRWQKFVADQFGTNKGKVRAIVHSPQTRYIFAKSGLPEEAIHLVRLACPPKRKMTLDSYDAKKLLGFPYDARVLTLFGFVGAYKGHDLAIEALKLLPANYHLAIVGGAHPEALDGFLHHLLSVIPKKLKHRVRITGYVESDVASSYYAATDVCLAPYRSNANLSASAAISWALSSGKPVIASKIEAFQAIQREAECMFMFTPGSAPELAWAIEKVDNDNALKTRLVDNADRYISQYSLENTARETMAIYNEMLGRKSEQVEPSMPRIHAAA